MVALQPQTTHMKLTTLSLAFVIASSALAQETVTVTTGPANSTQTYYSLTDGVQGEASIAAWDLAFEISGFTSSVQVNTAKGLTVYETPNAISDWSNVNSLDLDNWTRLFNSETYWSAGALTNGNNLDQPDGFNVGWGTYNMITHTIMGTKIYVIGMLDGTYKKLRVNSLISGTYSFTYADLDGTNEQTSTLVKSGFMGKNHGYFSFDGASVLDLEPASANWDLVFTKYTSIVPAPEPTPYSVAGVLQNKRVSAMQIDGVDPDLADWTTAVFDTSMNIIGYDWKSYNMGTSMYEYPTDRTYFVEDRSGNIWKIIFTEYGGSGNGNMTFTKELVSSVGVNERTRVTTELGVYPNPTSNGAVQVVLGASTSPSVLSVIDQAGRVVIEQLLPMNIGVTVHTVDVSTLSSGLYSVRVLGDGLQASSRLIVQ